jgi:uncharacterized protein with PIN domain
LRDAVSTLLSLRPWRCDICQKRFYAWSVPLAFARYAHCSHCGNLDLQRISREHVDKGELRWLMRLLHIRAYRCGKCRRRFFSLRRFRSIVPTHTKSPDWA